ncbi:sugar ABC transporter permease [Nocardia sp. NPDC051463]|uniref:carbohydrate ABC transporter permease n=1 Tax=Nocardia sp. NPDC051463 TaxID=3154845 RepID=UPI00344BA4C3
MLATVFVVSLIPVARTIWMSLRDTNLMEGADHFTGLANYRRLQDDSLFWQAWWQTIEFAAVTTFIETLLGIVVALVLDVRFRGRGLVCAIVLVPWAIPTVVTGRMFNWLFDQGGLVNYLLVRTHVVVAPISFLGSTTLAMPTLMVADIWKTTPFMALLLLAGLQTCPPQLEEAARLDGASTWGYFWWIRLPLLLPSLLVAALLRALDAVRVFDLPYAVTGGGPASTTETLSTYAYNTLFSGLDIGQGSAIATATFITEVGIAGVFGIFVLRQIRRDGRS